jgi:hypothetical protein
MCTTMHFWSDLKKHEMYNQQIRLVDKAKSFDCWFLIITKGFKENSEEMSKNYSITKEEH